jgi:hypothetical protein
MVDFRAVRRAVVDGQVRTNDITDLDLLVWGCIGLRHPAGQRKSGLDFSNYRNLSRPPYHLT